MDRYSSSERTRPADRDAHFSYEEPTGDVGVRSRRDDAPTRRIDAAADRPAPVEHRDTGRWRHANVLAEGPAAPARVRWSASFMLVLALYVGGVWYLMQPTRVDIDGTPNDAIAIDIVPDASIDADQPDDAPGPKVAESAAPTSEQTQADDPDPPAPDSAPPTEAKREPDKAPELTAPPAPAEATAVLPPPEQDPQEKPPEIKPVEKTPDAKEDTVDRKTAASRASTGSAALLSGGRRPSAAAQATWKGEIGSHLVKLRRYPQEARSRGLQGTARVRVKIDADGHVLDSELIKSSGQPLLDGEAIALMQRSDPFPKPPAGMPAPIVMTVPVNFSIR